MWRKRYFLFFCLLPLFTVSGQETTIKGAVVDASTFEPTLNVKVSIEGTTLETFTNELGVFIISSGEIQAGDQILIFSKPGYSQLRMPIKINEGEVKDLDLILLLIDFLKDQQQMGIISLSDSQLNEGEEGSADNIAGLLQASRDVFLNAAAFDFSQTFFRPRGLDSDKGKVYINGVEMNKLYNGRPQWSNWGGLNDVQRNQVFSSGLVPLDVGFGGLAGSTNIMMRASRYGGGGRISYALANRSYTGRIMATYNSGETTEGWAYSFSLSRRFAQEGYIDGTIYDANALFISVEKKINGSHSLNFATFYTPNIRGKSSANTREVYDLKGFRYNSFWGYQEGKIRNSRIREIKEPVFMLNHYWKISEKTDLNSNIAYQFGKVANTRIDFGGTRLVVEPNGQESYIGGGGNPDPAYYQRLPSYFFRQEFNPNYFSAYMAEEQIKRYGQLDWNKLYGANKITDSNGGNSVYILAEDRNDDRQITVNSILNSSLNENFKINGKIKYSQLISQNFASVNDLLGGTGYLDIDFFAEADATSSMADRAQSDLLNRNRVVGEGDRFKYNFEIYAQLIEGFTQLQHKSKRADLYLAGKISHSSYQRNGIFKNGSYPDNSLGKSELLNFTDFGGKAGGTYRLSGRHLMDFNLGLITTPPLIRNSFSNSRQNNEVVKGLKSEKSFSVDASYIYRTTHFRTKLTGYLTQLYDATNISFFYADGLSELGRTSSTAFVQEILSGINKRHLGLELGVEYQVTSTIKVKGVAAMGEYTFISNPLLYLTSDSFERAISYGEAKLKNYKVAGGPQRAGQLGFEYRDPDFWWFGTTLNYFSHAFINVSPLSRTSNFLTDVDGLPFLNYDEGMARKLLKQEQFDDYILVNAIGGKSWRIKDNYLGFFISLNNVFDVIFKTGGFEQSRNANYPTLKEDRERDHPLFGNKYWYGTGASYYANIYYRF